MTRVRITYKILQFIGCIAALSSCSKSSDTADLKRPFIGTWVVKKAIISGSSGGYSDVQASPAQQITFNANGTATSNYPNYVLHHIERYEILDNQTLQFKNMLHSSLLPQPYTYQFNGDTLVI